MFNFALEVCRIILHLSNIILQTIGCLILKHIYKNGGDNVQNMLVMNLSLSECLLSVTDVVAIILHMLKFNHPASYVDIFKYAGLLYSYVLSMIYISIDRFLATHLDLRYPLFCNEIKAKNLLIITWTLLICMIGSVITAIW